MKKSKLLIPAVAFLTVSIAAAATSTVAWFAASTSVAASASHLISATTEGSLTVQSKQTIAYGCSTDADSSFGTDANVTFGTLRDSSLNMTTETPSTYKVTKNPDGTVPAAASRIYTAANMAASSSKDATSDFYFYAKFSLVFKITAANTSVYRIFLNDPTLSTLTTPNGTDITSAIRVGYNAGTNYSVWAPGYIYGVDKLNTSTSALVYVNQAGTGAAAVSTYTFSETADSFATAHAFKTVPASVAYADNGKANYIGEATNGTDLEVVFYVWYEGEDFYCDEDLLTGATEATLGMHFAAIRE